MTKSQAKQKLLLLCQEVDSSVVAGLMKKGYKVIGITLKLSDDTQEVAKSKQCCAGQDN